MAMKLKWAGGGSMLLLGGAALLASHAVMAQDAAQRARAAQPVAEGTEDNVVIVTARRRSEKLQDVPVAVTSVGEKEIRQYDLTSVQNIKLVAPQITLDRGFSGAGGSISMRGVSSSSTGDGGVEQSVLIDYDGMAMSRGRVLNDPLFDMESIAVLKGPQALFFGKNSPGGVVSFKSAGPTEYREGYVRAGYETTADNKMIEAALSGPINDQWGYRVALYSSASKGYIYNSYRGGAPDLVRTTATGGVATVPTTDERLGGEKKNAARLTLKYKDGPLDATFKLMASKFEGTGQQVLGEVVNCPGRTQVQTIGATGAPLLDPNSECKLDNRTSIGWLSPTIIGAWPEVNKYNDGRPYSKNDTIMPTMTLNYKFDKLTVTSTTGLYDFDWVTQGNSDATAYSYFWSYSDEKNTSFYQELRAVSDLKGPLNYALGGHFEKNKRSLYVGGANGPSRMDAATGKYNTHDNTQNNRSSAYSVFGQLSYKLAPTLELAGGGRYSNETKELDSYNTFVNQSNPAVVAGYLPVGQRITGERTLSNFSPEATLTWNLSRDVMVYGAYKTGYLAGGFSNPGTLSATSSIDKFTFDSEKVSGFEIGSKATLLDRKLTGSLVAYRYDYKGLPVTSLVALDATRITYLTQNAASTLAQGVELEGSYKPFKGLTFNGSITYNDAHFVDFRGAQCYAGQTPATGCAVDPVTKGRSQDLSGRQVYRAPKWIHTAGAVFERQVGERLRLRMNADVRRSAAYYSNLSLNPSSFQPGFNVYNAGISLGRVDETWTLALIGRNLGNKRFMTLGLDKPGGAGEAYTVTGEPRAVTLQLEIGF